MMNNTEHEITPAQLKRKIIFHAIGRWAIVLSLLTVLILGGIKLFRLQDETNYRTAHVTCLAKLEELKSSEYSIYVNYVLVCREDNGAVFEIKVTPSTYVMSSVGDKMTFDNVHRDKLNESDQCVHCIMWGVLCFAAALILFSIMCASIPWLCGCDIEDKGRECLMGMDRYNWKRFTPQSDY